MPTFGQSENKVIARWQTRTDEFLTAPSDAETFWLNRPDVSRAGLPSFIASADARVEFAQPNNLKIWFRFD